MITFNIDNMFIDKYPIPINIVFGYSPLEVSYICFIHNYDRKMLISMIFDQLKSMGYNILDTYNFPSTINNIWNTYKVPLMNNKLLEYILTKYNYDSNDIKIFSEIDSINMIKQLNELSNNFDYPFAYINPNATLRQIIDLVISNHPNDTISLLYYQHKYVILGLSIIYRKLANASNWVKYDIKRWFDTHKEDLYVETFQTLNYLTNYNIIQWEQVVKYFQLLENLYMCRNIVKTNIARTGIKIIIAELYSHAGLSSNEIDTFMSYKNSVVDEFKHNLNLITRS